MIETKKEPQSPTLPLVRRIEEKDTYVIVITDVVNLVVSFVFVVVVDCDTNQF